MTTLLGARIRLARLKAGMTQNQLARAIETSDRNVQRWESGDNEPRAAQVRRIAIATSTTIDELLADDEDAEAAKQMLADLSRDEYALYGQLTARILRHRSEQPERGKV